MAIIRRPVVMFEIMINASLDETVLFGLKMHFLCDFCIYQIGDELGVLVRTHVSYTEDLGSNLIPEIVTYDTRAIGSEIN